MKKAVEMQFNWIYVAVVGGIILIVFVGIAAGIRKNARANLEYEVLASLDGIFSGLQGSENTEYSINIGDLDLEIDTGRDQCNRYRIGKSNDQGKSLEYISVFSPDKIDKNILSYSLGWDAPYRASYFLYLTSPDVSYVIEDETIFNDLPSHITKKKLTGFTYQNYAKVKYVLTDSDPSSITLPPGVKKMDNEAVTAVRIIPRNAGNIYGGGKLEFYTKSGSSFPSSPKTTYYVDKPTLFAAVYADKDAYECNLEKAISRLGTLAGILDKRADYIKNSELVIFCQNNLNWCKCNTGDYSSSQTYLGQIKDTAASFSFDEGIIDSLSASRLGLEGINERINRNSCPTVY